MNAHPHVRPELAPLLVAAFVVTVGLTTGCATGESLTEDPAQAPFREHIRTTEWQTPGDQLAAFQLPPGFEITLFASEPDIGKPINMEFDVRGRLWVTQSSEYPFPADPGAGTDRITILEDTNGNGKADTFIDVADTLNIPIGIMPMHEGAIVYSIPNVYRLTDQDADGKATNEEIMLGEFGYEDTHGMVSNLIRGFDGWIHANHGYTNASAIAGADGDSITMTSGHTFRFLPDGSRVELTTIGRVNPFGYAYDEWGYLYGVDSHSMPIYQLITGAEYPSFDIRPEPHIGFGPRMMDYTMGTTAIAGLAYYTDDQFPDEYRNSFYSGNVTGSRVNRNSIEFVGSTPVATREEDFVISSDPWFRPVDFATGPDGSLYIADFYNRVIGHYEVALDHPGRDRHSGRIWRIRYRGEGSGDADHQVDWSSATIPDLVMALDHPVLSTRMKIADQLVDHYEEQAIDPVTVLLRSRQPDSESFIQGLWILHRLDALPAGLLNQAIMHDDPMVRTHALRVLAETRDLTPEMHTHVTSALVDDENPHVRRAAAEVLSRRPNMDNLQSLLAILTTVPEEDTHLGHTALIGVRHQLNDAEIMREVASRPWDEDQLSVLMKAVPDVPTEAAASFAFEYLQGRQLAVEDVVPYMAFIGRYSATNELPRVTSFVQNGFADETDVQYRLHRAIRAGMEQRGSGVAPHMREWAVRLAARLLEEAPGRAPEEGAAWQVQAAELVEEYEIVSLERPLRELLATRDADSDVRAAAAAALLALSFERNTPLLADVFHDANETLEVREKVATAFGQAPVPAVFSALETGLEDAPPSLQKTIATVLGSSTEGIDYLIRALRAGRVPAEVLSDAAITESLMANSRFEHREQLAELPAWGTGSEERDSLIEARLNNFDPARVSADAGRAIFEQHCMMCHQVQDAGGLIGPQLDGIGSWGAMALTEKIIDPNRNVSESFRVHHVALTDGTTFTGLFRREAGEGEVLIFVDTAGEEVAIAATDIEERRVSNYSLMPAHFGEVLDQSEFDALLGYLLSLD